MAPPAPDFFIDGLNDLLGAIGDAAESVSGDAASLAAGASAAFSDAVASTQAEWEEFVDNLTETQTDALARLTAFMDEAASTAADLAATRAVLSAPGFGSTGTDVAALVESAMQVIEAGSQVLADFRDAFGANAVDPAIRSVSPLLARKMRLPGV